MLLAAVAAAVMVVGVGVVAVPSGEMEQATAAELLSQSSAAARKGGDQPLSPGRYRYVETRGWYTGGSEYFTVPSETVSQLWIPADLTDEWRLVNRTTGRHKTLAGDPGDDTRPSTEVLEGVCGDLQLREDLERGRVKSSCDHVEGGWYDPTPEWLAELPRDPDRLAQRLRSDSDNDMSLMFENVVAALGSGLLPADVRGALYQALADLPGIEVSDDGVNLDGRKGVAFGLGERNVLNRSTRGVPEGTVTSCSAVRTAVVDGMGKTP